MVYEHHNHDILEDSFPDNFLPDAIDGLVYCPGTINLKPFRSLSLDVFRQDYELNVLGAVKAIKACLKPMKKSENGPSVVLFSSVANSAARKNHGARLRASNALCEL